MPPKSSSGGRPWQGRTRASKSMTAVPSKCTSSIPKSSAPPSSSSTGYLDNHLAPPPPSNTTATVSSDKKKRALQTKNLSPGESSSRAISDVEFQEKPLILASPNRINFGDEAEEKRLGDSSSLDETLGDPEKAVANADIVRIVVEGGKRKVVKKVKVFKKVVKRVMKKVPKGCSASSETKKVVHGGDLNESIQNLETVSNVSQSERIGKIDPIGNDSLEVVKFGTNDIAPLGNEYEDSTEKKVDSMEVENDNSFAVPVTPIGILSEVPLSVHSEGKVGEGIQNQIKYGKDSGHFVEQSAVSVEKGASEVKEVVKEFVENNGAVLGGEILEDHAPVSVEEGAREVEELEKAFMEKNGAGLNGDFVEGENMIKVEDGASEVEEVVNEFAVNNGASLRGEIEAVEKRSCRQKEIFLGGLDEDTEVEDIRKVFEKVDGFTEVRLKMNSKTGKNKGFAFVQFASAADAKKALTKYSKVEICGKQCDLQPVGGSDTLFLGNINKKWKDHDVIRLLNQEGIDKIDKATVKGNPNNPKQNRGFAFVEFEASKDAEVAYNKLQKNYVFNQQLKIKVAWAQPLVEPDKKEVLKVKSIYAEFIPSFWDEKKVKIFFKRFGEIESIAFARYLPSSRRKDFAFVTYTTRDAALACMEAFNHEQVDEDGSKVNVKVSLAYPHKRSKQKKHVSSSTRKEHSRDEPKTPQSIRGPGSEEIRRSNNHEAINDRINSTTVELIRLLRQQASHRPMQAGSSDLNYHYSLSGSKRTFHELYDHVPSSDSRGFLHTRPRSSSLAWNPSYFPRHIGSIPSPNSQQRNFGYTFESFNGIPNNPHFQTREQPQFFGYNRIFQR